ncbi:hypothetical protein [Streptomyces sp. SR-10]|uniref:hypothetical protein n=1 Tax=Streptomyces sp. SR-10 TaxID=3416442 RepID=UPI003CE6E557
MARAHDVSGAGPLPRGSPRTGFHERHPAARHPAGRRPTARRPGANVPGKPRVFLAHVGGTDRYREARDGYTGFTLSGPPA